MRDALDRDEFWVAYQPQMDLLTNVLIGVEALLRSERPAAGAYFPRRLHPGSGGHRPDRGPRVSGSRAGLSRRGKWPKPIKIAVNISPIQFMRGDLARTVAEALQSSGLPPSELDLEITELLFVRESSEIRSVTSELRKMGVSFSLDDFGTGYSSLNYLRKFQVDKIKLDRSFVIGLPHELPELVAIVRAVCALGKRPWHQNQRGGDRQPRANRVPSPARMPGRARISPREAPSCGRHCSLAAPSSAAAA